jgi:homeobox protein cut-like
VRIHHFQAGNKSRKKLLDATKSSNAEREEASEAERAKLLALYKAELQSLAKRAKYAEASFLSLYRKLAEAPDPAPLLAAASYSSSTVAENEAEIRRLKQELEGDHAELESMRDLHARAARLEARNAELECAMEAKIAEIVRLRAEDNEKEMEEALSAAAASEHEHAAQVTRRPKT